jgi:phosphatidate cytidylyltransferase
VLFFFPPYILTAIISILCAIAAYELLSAAGSSTRVKVYAIITAPLAPFAVYLSFLLSSINSQFSILISLLLSIAFILICLLLIDFFLTIKSDKRMKLKHILAAVVAGIIIPCMLSSLIYLKTIPYGYLLVFLPVISTVITDSGAYFTGKAIGKKKAFPIISPNKTVEGCVGGLVSGTVAMLLYGLILVNTTPLTVIYPLLIVYGIVGAIITELGDLAFSFIKRKCSIKDYGKLIPGHGGVLDRFDSMIFTAPVMYFLVISLPAIVI